MLTGRFGNTSNAPFIEAHLFFPRLRLRGLVSLLVDTGADGTVLMPEDSRKLAINFNRLINPTSSEGIGGLADGFLETCILTFGDKRYLYSYTVDVEIAEPTKYNAHFPSILGRDVMQNWRLIVDKEKMLVRARVYKSDVKIRI